MDVSAERADGVVAPLPEADVALSNVTRQVVEQLAPRLRSPRFVASGYLVSEPASLPEFRHVRRASADGWAADLFERSPG